MPGKLRGCTTVRRKYKLDASSLPDGGRMEYKTAWCWSRWAKDTKYQSNSQSLIPRLSLAWEAIAGLNIEKQDFTVTPYTWNDGRAIDMNSPFDAKSCLPLKIQCVTVARFEIVRRARWNGSHYGEMRNR